MTYEERAKIIEQFEIEGKFNDNIEQDPEFKPLQARKINFGNKGVMGRLLSYISTRAGKKFFDGMMKKKIVVLKEPTGYENLEGFDEGAIITCNHFHHFDNYAALLAIKGYFKKTRLFRVIREGNYAIPGVVGFLMRNCDTLPVSNDGSNPRLTVMCMNAVAELLQNKNNKVLIYPEQSMWWNYRKPRPMKAGAFMFAAKAKKPIIPCFITLKDSDIIGGDGAPVQEFTVNILPIIKYNEAESTKENAERMMNENYNLWKECYEKTYGIPLVYKTKNKD